MEILGAVDMGSSGARVARVRVGAGTPELVSAITEVAKTERRRAFVRAVRDAVGDVPALGVAIAGPTDPTTGRVRFAGAYPWARGDLAGTLAGRSGTPVTVINDAEAHLWAHLDAGAHPMVCLAVGTGLGFALTDDTGRIRRPRVDTNWELGHLRVLRSVDEESTGPQDTAALALGSRGLDALCAVHGPVGGADRFGSRLAGFVHGVSVTFQPRTVMLAGGVTAGLGEPLAEAVRQVLADGWPASVHQDPPAVLVSPHGADSGLLGAAAFAADRHRDARG